MGGAETTVTQVKRPLPYVHRASLGVTLWTSVGRGGNRGRDGIRSIGLVETVQRRGGYRGEERDPTKWERVVNLVQTAFWGGVLEEEETWQAVVLIPEWGGDYRGIGIVFMVWKAVAVILNWCFTASIGYPDSLHGFQTGYGTGTENF